MWLETVRNRRTKKRAKNSSPSFLLHIIWLMGARFWIIICNLFLSVLIARQLGAADWGTLAALNILLSTSAQFGLFGLTSSSTLLVARNRGKFNPIACNMLLFALSAGTLVAVSLIFIAWFASDLFGNLPFNLIALTLLSLPFLLLLMLNQNILLGAKRIGRFNLLDLASPTLLAFNAVIAVWVLQTGIFAIVVLNTVSIIILSLLSSYLIRQTGKEEVDTGKFQPDVMLFKQMVSYGFRFYLILLVSFVIIRADVLIVNMFRDAAETGVYALAAQIASLFLLLPVVINTLLFQRVAEESDNRSVELTCSTTRRTALVMLIACLLAIPGSFILPFIYGAAFTETTKLFLILLPGVYLLGLESVLVQYFTGTNLPYRIAVFWLIVLLLNLTANLIFVPKFGAQAAAIVSSVSYLLIFLLITVYFQQKTGSQLKDILIPTSEERRELLNGKLILKIFGK